MRNRQQAEGVDYFRRGLELVEGIDAPGQQSNFLPNLGIVHTEDHEFDAAFGYFDRVLEIYRAHHDRRGEADVLVKLAETHRLSGSESAALETAAQALELARLAKTRLTEGEAFWRLGDVHADRGDMELARAHCSNSSLVRTSRMPTAETRTAYVTM